MYELNALPEQRFTAGRVCSRCGEAWEHTHACKDVVAAHAYAQGRPSYLAAVREYLTRLNGVSHGS